MGGAQSDMVCLTCCRTEDGARAAIETMDGGMVEG